MEPYPLNSFEEKFNLKTNFLEYCAFCRVIKDYLSQKVLPIQNPTDPVNSYLNIVLSLDKKGVSNIYKIMLGNHSNILLETSNKWNEKMNLNLSSFSIGRSFRKITIIDDTYLRYIQFRTLHRRFYTNNILHKIEIKDSDICGLCKKEKDSNEHMLIQCEVSNTIWINVQSWIQEIGIEDYIITDEKKILGDFNCSYWVNAIIFNKKKCIFIAKIREVIPTLSYIKSCVKNMHSYEKFSFELKDKERIFIQRWGIYTDNVES